MALKRLVPALVNLNEFNSPVQTGIFEPITGLELPSGLVAGDYFDFTEAEANSYSNAATGTLHAGRYRLVQVDAAATAAKIAVGRLGALLTFAKGLNVVTDFDSGLASGTSGFHVVVFLNTALPGNYCFVQELGVATCKCVAAVTAVVQGGPVVSAATGLVDSAALATALTYGLFLKIIGVALDAPANNALIKVELELPVLQG